MSDYKELLEVLLTGDGEKLETLVKEALDKGAPVNQTFADEIGADGYAPDAGSASKLAKTLLRKSA